MSKTKMNEKGQIEMLIVGLILLLLFIAALIGFAYASVFWNWGSLPNTPNVSSFVAKWLCSENGIGSIENPIPDNAPFDATNRRCLTTDVNMYDGAAKLLEQTIASGGYKPGEDWAFPGLVYGIWKIAIDQYVRGVSEFKGNSIIAAHCWNEPRWGGLLGYYTKADIFVPDDGKCYEQPNMQCAPDPDPAKKVSCQPIPANPTGKLYECNSTSKKCEEKTCDLPAIKTNLMPRLQAVCDKNIWDLNEQEMLPFITAGLLQSMIPQLVCIKPLCDVVKAGGDINTANLDAGCMGIVCQLMNADNCNLDLKDKDCPTSPPPGAQCTKQEDCPSGQACDTSSGKCVDCTLPQGCKGDAGALDCGTDNKPTNLAACDEKSKNCPQGQTCNVPSCPGGNTGYLCNGIDTYCDPNVQATDKCVPISSIKCDTNPKLSEVKVDPIASASLDCAKGTQAKWGLVCGTGFVCDIQNLLCVSPSQLREEKQHSYFFDLKPGFASAVGLNFAPIENTAFAMPQLCIPEDPASIYCSSCSSDLQKRKGGIEIRYEHLKSKGGTLHFRVIPRGLGGQNNYVVLQYNDVQNQEGKKKINSERFVVEVEASQVGECALEGDTGFSGDTTGETGDATNAMKIGVKYDWEWNSTPSNFCENYACDSTQFMLSLLKRLKEIKDLYEAQNFLDALKKQDFSVLLMADSLPSDFRNDFNQYYSFAAAGVENWYRDNTAVTEGDYFYKYETNAAKLAIFPESIATPGRYAVKIDIAGGTQFFNSSHQPALFIMVGLTPQAMPKEWHMDNAIYRLPLDGFVGTFPQGNSRQGYGVSFAQGSTPIQLTGNTSLDNTLFSSTGGQSTIASSKLVTFDETNMPEHRGRVLEIVFNKSGNSEIVFSPTIATPVAMRIPQDPANKKGDGRYYGTYFLTTGDQAQKAYPSHTTFANWTGIGSKKLNDTDPACSDFVREPLGLAVSDVSSNISEYGSILGPGIKALGFAPSNPANDKFLVFATVFYRPKDQEMLIAQTGDKTELLTPIQKIASPAATALSFTSQDSLKRSELPNGLKIETLKDIINLFNSDLGAVCIKTKTSDDGSSTRSVFFWNRGKLLQEIVDRQHTPFSSAGSNPVSVVGAPPKVTDMDSGYLCSLSGA